MSATPELLTVAEAARRLGMSRATFDRKWKDGTLARLGVREANRLTWRRHFDAASVQRALWRQDVRPMRRSA